MCVAVQICLSHFSQPTFEGLPEEDQDWVTTQASSVAVTGLHPGMQVHVALSQQGRLPDSYNADTVHASRCRLDQQFWPVHARPPCIMRRYRSQDDRMLCSCLSWT